VRRLSVERNSVEFTNANSEGEKGESFSPNVNVSHISTHSPKNNLTTNPILSRSLPNVLTNKPHESHPQNHQSPAPKNIYTETLIKSFEKGRKKTSNKQSHAALDNITHNLLMLSQQDPLLGNCIIEEMLGIICASPNFSNNYNVLAKGSETANDMTAILLKKWEQRLLDLEAKEDYVPDDSSTNV